MFSDRADAIDAAVGIGEVFDGEGGELGAIGVEPIGHCFVPVEWFHEFWWDMWGMGSRCDEIGVQKCNQFGF